MPSCMRIIVGACSKGIPSKRKKDLNGMGRVFLCLKLMLGKKIILKLVLEANSDS